MFYCFFYYYADCGLVAHRTCARTGLPSCLTGIERPAGLQFKSVFGLGLCAQFNPQEMPAPQLVCIKPNWENNHVVILFNAKIANAVKTNIHTGILNFYLLRYNYRITCALNQRKITN